MAIETIVAGVMPLLQTYVSLVGQGFAQRHGEMLADKAGAIFRAIRTHFAKDDYAAKTLERLAEKPQADDRLAALKGVLSEKLQENSEFAKLLEQLLAEARTADTKGVFVVGDRNIGIGGSATGVFNTGDDATLNKI